MISLTRIARMADLASGEDDDAVLAAFEAFQPSYNAEAAFQGLLGAVCAIALHRPHLLEQILPHAIDPGVCIGVETLEDFWRYADFYAREALETPRPGVPDFTEETVKFLREDLRKQEALVSRLLQECRARLLEE
jgi:hypothetical protein